MLHSDFVVLSFLFLAHFISILLMDVLLAGFLKLLKKKTHYFQVRRQEKCPLPLHTEAGVGVGGREGGGSWKSSEAHTLSLCKALESAPAFLAPCGLIASGLANFQLFSASGVQIFLINNKRFCWDQGCFPPSPCKPGQHKLRTLAFQGTSYYGGQESPSWWMKPILSSLVTSVLTFKARKETR